MGASVRQQFNDGTSIQIGFLTAVIGLAITLGYAATVLSRENFPVGVPLPTSPVPVYISVIVGPVLLTWGVFAVRHQTLTPLTLRRALVAPLLSLLGTAAGIIVFVIEVTAETPIEIPSDTSRGSTTYDPSILELVRWEFTGVQVLALVAVSGLVVGTVIARKGWRAGAASAALPAAFAAVLLADWWRLELRPEIAVTVLAVLAVPPLAVGYFAASPE